jgi:hypothetical protein
MRPKGINIAIEQSGQKKEDRHMKKRGKTPEIFRIARMPKYNENDGYSTDDVDIVFSLIIHK